MDADKRAIRTLDEEPSLDESMMDPTAHYTDTVLLKRRESKRVRSVRRECKDYGVRSDCEKYMKIIKVL